MDPTDALMLPASGADGWLMPDWPAPPGVVAVCTTRRGGLAGTASLPPYDDFNLGDHVGDRLPAVLAHRAALAARLPVRPVYLRQVHGTGVLELRGHEADGSEADACVTARPGLACTIMVADCLPVLFTTADGLVVGAAHAGWRGLAAGVLEAALAQLLALHASRTGVGPPAAAPAVLAWLGPCIGPQAFEVGAEVRAAFMAQDPACADLFSALGGEKYLADLPGLARRRLAARGLQQIHGNDGSTAWCTVSNPSRFFSHRRDRVSGRFAACVGRL